MKSSVKGMYCIYCEKLANLPDFLDGKWIQFGIFYNGYVEYCAIWVSFFVIFYSDNPFDLVMNAIALLFLEDLDDLLVDNTDYKDVEIYLKDYEPRLSLKTQSKCRQYFYMIMEKVDLFALYITLFAAVVVPFYIGVCF